MKQSEPVYKEQYIHLVQIGNRQRLIIKNSINELLIHLICFSNFVFNSKSKQSDGGM